MLFFFLWMKTDQVDVPHFYFQPEYPLPYTRVVNRGQMNGRVKLICVRTAPRAPQAHPNQFALLSGVSGTIELDELRVALPKLQVMTRMVLMLSCVCSCALVCSSLRFAAIPRMFDIEIIASQEEFNSIVKQEAAAYKSVRFLPPPPPARRPTHELPNRMPSSTNPDHGARYL